MADGPDLDKISRQRLDFEEHPDGSVTAILTVTLPDGTVQRYRSTSTPEELDQFASAIANAETKLTKRIEGMSDEEIAGIFGDIWNGVKSVGKAVAKVATSKVFKAASKGLASIAPALGPYAPAAMAVSGGMQVTSKIAQSALAAEAGANRAARALGIGAKKRASAMTRGKPKLTNALLKWGSRKRKSAFGLATDLVKKTRGDALRRLAAALKKRKKSKTKKKFTKKQRENLKRLARILKKRKAAAARKKRRKPKPKRKAKQKKKATPKRRTSTRISVLAAARTGRLRSNKPGDVSEKQLQQVAKKGRVFWISAT